LNGKSVTLTAQEFKLLKVFAGSPRDLANSVCVCSSSVMKQAGLKR
jgi:hypothetical protein